MPNRAIQQSVAQLAFAQEFRSVYNIVEIDRAVGKWSGDRIYKKINA